LMNKLSMFSKCISSTLSESNMVEKKLINIPSSLNVYN